VVVQAEQTQFDRAAKLLLAVGDSVLPHFYDALLATDQRDVVSLMSVEGLSFIHPTYCTFMYLLMMYCQLCRKIIILHVSVEPFVSHFINHCCIFSD